MFKQIILLFAVLIPSLCFGGDTYRLRITHFEEHFEKSVFITSYDEPTAFKISESFKFNLKNNDPNTSSMQKLMLYLREEKLLTHFTEKVQSIKFLRYDHYLESLILNQFLFSNYKVTAFNTESIRDTYGKKTIKTYFFSK